MGTMEDMLDYSRLYQRKLMYGKRTDGTQKGYGWLGELPMTDGRVMTEMSLGVNLGGKDTTIPAIVPTLTQEEIDHLAAGNKPHDGIIQKAVEHAKKRIAEGNSPYAQPQEQIVPAASPARRRY
jgi:hypothetical protein